MKSHLWIVAYDVSDDKRRRRVEQRLLALGQRVQYSVFECHLTIAEARLHLGCLALDLDCTTDSLRAYPQCAWCVAGRLAPESLAEHARVVVV